MIKRIVKAWLEKMEKNKHGFKKVCGRDALRLKTSIMANTKNGIVFNPCAYEKEDIYTLGNLEKYSEGTKGDFLQLQRKIISAYVGLRNEKKGGMLIFSTEVNANVGKDIISKIWGWLQTVYNSITKKDRIRNVVDETVKETGIGFGVTVGKNFIGRYSAPNGETFDETSLTVTILGVSTDVLYALADKLMEEFNQEAVAFQDYNDGSSGLLNYGNKPTE